MTRARFLLVPVLCSVLACDDERTAPTEDELAGESAEDGEPGKFDGADGTFTFFRVEGDFRKCSAPLCGGFWVSRVNRSQTRCIDGSWADQCYVAAADLSAIGMPESQQGKIIEQLRAGLGVLRGDIVPFGDGSDLGTLAATEVWIANSDSAADGVFTRVDDSGIVCITAPCPNPLQEAKLNSQQASVVIDEIDLSWTDADEAAIEAAYGEVYGQAGLVMAGYRYYYWDGGWKKGRIATQFYTRVVADPVAEPAECVRAGCSSELCVAADQADIATPCIFRPEFACYADATCELQEDGACGFTPTDELQACLDDAD